MNSLEKVALWEDATAPVRQFTLVRLIDVMFRVALGGVLAPKEHFFRRQRRLASGMLGQTWAL